MTITTDQYKRIGTFGSAHGQVLDNELLYMVMQSLVTVTLDTQAFTGKSLLVAALTSEGEKACDEFYQKQKTSLSKEAGA